MSTTAGLHVPSIPLVDVVGIAATGSPAQMVSEVPKLNVGVILLFTVTEKLAGAAQSPAVGVNVYTPDALLSTVAGLQLPVIPLVDVDGNAGTLPPAQIVNAVPKVNVGTVG